MPYLKSAAETRQRRVMYVQGSRLGVNSTVKVEGKYYEWMMERRGKNGCDEQS